MQQFFKCIACTTYNNTIDNKLVLFDKVYFVTHVMRTSTNRHNYNIGIELFSFIYVFLYMLSNQ